MDTVASRQKDIESVFDRLGLATANDRGTYLVAEPKPPIPNFNVVISSTSNPHFS